MQSRSVQTHAQILRAAQDLFAQTGYDGTGVAEICERAGVSKGAFYHHFPSKQAVFLELLERWLNGLEGRLVANLDTGDSIPGSLVDMTCMLREVFLAADGRLSMFLEFWTQAIRDPVFWQATIQPYHHYQALFEGMFQQGVETGALRPVDAGTASRLVLAIVIGILLQGLLDPQGTDWEQVARQGMGYLLTGLEVQSKEG